MLFNPAPQEETEADDFEDSVRRARAERKAIREQLQKGELEEREVEIEVEDTRCLSLNFGTAVPCRRWAWICRICWAVSCPRRRSAEGDGGRGKAGSYPKKSRESWWIKT
jgi:hypothetical protein